MDGQMNGGLMHVMMIAHDDVCDIDDYMDGVCDDDVRDNKWHLSQ